MLTKTGQEVVNFLLSACKFSLSCFSFPLDVIINGTYNVILAVSN